MTTNDTPINRQAALFLSRKKRIETLSQAMEKFADSLLGPEIAQNLRDLIRLEEAGHRASLRISVSIHRDERTVDQYTAKLRSSVVRELGEQLFHGLK